jgi:hypothetical protein
MKTLQTIAILALIHLLSGCDNRKSEFEFEKKVMRQIFPDLIDSLWIHSSSLDNLPFVKLDKKGNVIGLEEQDQSVVRKSHLETLHELKKSKSKLFVAIYDTIHSVGSNHMIDLTKHYKDAIVAKDKRIDTIQYPLDRKEFTKIKHIKVLFISKFVMGERPWESNYGYTFNGFISFSRIQFDDAKKYGVLTCAIDCGGLCGRGYTIFIKKIKNTWVIDSVVDTWIS